ncbi:MAG: spondin domain-containing protein [Pseudomonadota bacterium]
MNKLAPLFCVLFLAACSDNDNDAAADTTTPAPAPAPAPLTNASFEVAVTNLTLGQPLSPIAAVIHDDSYRAFRTGEPASAGLELLAEAGDNSGLLDEVQGAGETSGSAPVAPGASDLISVEIEGDDVTGMHLTVMTMLVNTNDAITGINGIDLSDMPVGSSRTLSTIAYDSGTEANSETAGTIPGPAGGGEGFNAIRDDIVDHVTAHAGVVTSQDGLMSSDLTQTHRWDNPVARFTITRTQ